MGFNSGFKGLSHKLDVGIVARFLVEAGDLQFSIASRKVMSPNQIPFSGYWVIFPRR